MKREKSILNEVRQSLCVTFICGHDGKLRFSEEFYGIDIYRWVCL